VGAVDTALLATPAALAATPTQLTAFTPKAFSLSNDAEGNLRLPVTATKAAGSLTWSGSINLTLTMQALPL
jgi:hypothetical protein